MRLIHQIVFGRNDASKPALIVPEKGLVLTYDEIVVQCTRLAEILIHEGVSPGHRVAVLLPNSPEFAIAFFTSLRIGGIVIPLDANARKKEILETLHFIKPEIIITNESQLRKITPEVASTTKICMLDFSDGKVDIQLQKPSPAASQSRAESTGQSLQTVKPEDDALFIMTSGSTGTPKAVRLSHRAVLNNIRMHLGSLEIGASITGLQVLPMNYSYGLIASFLSILYDFGTVVLMPSLDAAKISEYVEQYQINVLMGTPTIFRYFFDSMDSRKAHAPSMESLRHITLGGDQCPIRLADTVRTRLPHVKTYITYGLSETGPRVSTLPPQCFATLSHSIGLPLDGVEVKIIDEDGRVCALREIGEIVVRTPSVMNGYFGQEQETADVHRDGWFYTGDLGSRDGAGFLFYNGRKDRVFKVNEKKINPAVIERCIYLHPLVEDCRVSKVSDGQAESIRAVIRTKSPHDLVDELKSLCRRELPLHMVPREFTFDHSGHYYFKGKLVR